jgi:hypothetical protein
MEWLLDYIKLGNIYKQTIRYLNLLEVCITSAVAGFIVGVETQLHDYIVVVVHVDCVIIAHVTYVAGVFTDVRKQTWNTPADIHFEDHTSTS